jgi:hypothetical protein
VNRFHSFLVRAMSATEESSTRFDSVPDDFAPAMIALRRQGVDSAFKTIEIPRDAVHQNFNRLIVLIPTNFTLMHTTSHVTHVTLQPI